MDLFSKFSVYVIKYIKYAAAVVFVQCKNLTIVVPGGKHRRMVLKFLDKLSVLLSNMVHHHEFLLHGFTVFHYVCLRICADHTHNHWTGSTISTISWDSVYSEYVRWINIDVNFLFENGTELLSQVFSGLLSPTVYLYIALLRILLIKVCY